MSDGTATAADPMTGTKAQAPNVVTMPRANPLPEEPPIKQADDLDWEGAQPQKISARAVNEQGGTQKLHKFQLTQTSINLGQFPPGFAVVRLVSLADRSLVGTLPTEVRQVVDRIYNTNVPQNIPDSERTEHILHRAQEVASAYCVAGFVDPKVCWRREDASDGVMWVGAIALHDRQEFMRICESEDVIAARRLKPFLDEPAPAL